jgi:hypothetical protein
MASCRPTSSPRRGVGDATEQAERLITSSMPRVEIWCAGSLVKTIQVEADGTRLSSERGLDFAIAPASPQTVPWPRLRQGAWR